MMTSKIILYWKSKLRPGFRIHINTIKEANINSCVKIKPGYEDGGKTNT